MFDFKSSRGTGPLSGPRGRGQRGNGQNANGPRHSSSWRSGVARPPLDQWIGAPAPDCTAPRRTGATAYRTTDESQTTYNVEIPAASAVTMDINPTINNLTLDAASSSLNIEAARSFCSHR